MAGIYLHIPFCKGKCAYCDFYSVGTTQYKSRFVQAICDEIDLRKDYLSGEKIQTIYFGGGTPSMLETKELNKILNKIHKVFKIDKNSEITLEANPDDLNLKYIKELRSLGFNRLSVGIQSFKNSDLQLMRRKHDVNQSIKSVSDAQNEGFKNISVDLIYGLPNLSLSDWEINIQNALNLNIQHISAYHLTIEPKTLFYKYYKNQKIILPSEIESLNQFELLIEKAKQNGFLQYEISNFAKDGFISLHNTNYWMGVKYLGLGPSAHSYNLTSRQWNIQNLQGYLDGIFKGKMVIEKEILAEKEKFNDYLITSLRTMWGLNTEIIKKQFGKNYEKHIKEKARTYIDKNILKEVENNLILTDNGMFISDNVIQELFYD